MVTRLTARRVSPFGHRGLNACVPLPRAYRSLPRPSSPLCAQASPTYVRSLDSALRGTNPSGTRSSKARAYRTSDASSRINSSQAALESCRSDYASLRFFVQMVTPSPLRDSACHPIPTFTSPSVVKQRPDSAEPSKLTWAPSREGALKAAKTDVRDGRLTLRTFRNRPEGPFLLVAPERR